MNGSRWSKQRRGHGHLHTVTPLIRQFMDSSTIFMQ